MSAKSALIRSVILACFTIFLTAVGLANPEPSAIVSAASFEEQIAPGSIASLFGSELSTETLAAELDGDGLLPTQLGGVSVEIDGQPAGLIYVSPTQINFYLDPSLTPGPITVTVRVNGESAELTTTLYDVAPGLFLLPCVRFNRGAVLEGLTDELESFRATNSSVVVGDNRTRLTLWGTGIRFATLDGLANAAPLVRVEAIDRTGRTIELPVEYAGPAPLFFGLDQVNAIIPAILANAGFVELRIWIGDDDSNRISVLLIEDTHQGQLEVVTEAGTGADDSAGDDGPALQAALREPAATAADRQGNLYIADATARVIRKVSPDGIITTFAGTGEEGGSGDGGAATAATFRRPIALAVDRNGDIFVADSEDHRVRRIDATDGKIYAFAGTGLDGDGGDLGLATQASLSAPVSIAFNIHGSLYIVDQSNERVRKVYGDGYISAYAGTGEPGPAGDGGPALLAVLTNPTSVAVGLDQSVLIGDGTRRIRRVDPTGTIRTVGGAGQDGDADSGVPFESAPLGLGLQLATDPNGGVCITDGATNKIRAVGADCKLHTFGGTGTPGVSPDHTAALNADLNHPTGPSFGPAGEIFFASPENRLVRRLARVVRDEGGICVQSLEVVLDRGALMPEEPLYGFVRFNCPVEADTVVVLSSDHQNLLIPASVTVLAGKQLAFFSPETLPFDNPNLSTYFSETANVTATSGAFNDTTGATLVVWRDKLVERVEVSKPVVIGGDTLSATAWLSRPAWLGGVTLAANAGPSASTEQSIFVSEQMRSVEFLIRTEPVTTRTLARVSVSGPDGPPTEGPFIIDPTDPEGPQLVDILSLTVTPNAVTGGEGATGRVVLYEPAPEGGAEVFLHSSNTMVGVPESIIIEAGAVFADFPISTSEVETPEEAEITALSKNQVNDVLLILPEGGNGGGTILGLAIEPNSVNGGETATGVVTLTEPAPLGGVVVTLASADPAASVPATVNIPSGQTGVSFSISTSSVETLTAAGITATANNSVMEALTINPGQGGPGEGEILSLVIAPNTVTGGESATGTVTLAAAAPAGGILVTLASDDPAATVPGSITIPAGQTAGQFPVSTTPVESTTVPLITATSANSVSEALTIEAEFDGPGEGEILSLVVSPESVTGGESATGTVTLAASAPAGGILVTLASDDPAATTPASITIPEGQTTGEFQISTTEVESTTVPLITATSANAVSDTLTIQPDSSGVGEGEILSLIVSPDSVVGGDSSTGTVTLAEPAPEGGVLVTLTSDDPAATVSASVTIAEGQTTAEFAISTTAVVATTAAEIAGTSLNVVSDILTVNPMPCVSSIQINVQDFLGTVLGGTSLSAIVHLTGPAPQAGLDVQLTSALLDVSLPASVHVLPGELSASFTITTHAVSSLVSSLITASVGPCPGIEITIGVEPPCVASLNLSVGSVIGGGSILGEVTLTGPAPAGGSEVTLVSSDAALNAPLSVLVPEGQTSAQFTVNIAAVPTILHSTLQVLLGDCPGVQVELDILAPILQALGVNQSAFPLLGGSTTATVTLSGPAPAGGISIQLAGSQETIFQGLLSGLLKVVVPNQVTVPEGQTTANFNVTASLVGTILNLLSDHDGSVTATLGATVKNVDVLIEGIL